MAEETQTAEDARSAEATVAAETNTAPAVQAEGMAALGALSEISAAPTETASPAEPKIDKQGRAYATGRRKNAIARVWVKRGTGQISINGRDITTYFARPVLQMVLQQPFETAERTGEFDVIATVVGGGLSGRTRAYSDGTCCAQSSANAGRAAGAACGYDLGDGTGAG